MKTTLEKTLELAYADYIDDSDIVATATSDLINMPFITLDAVSKHFYFVRLDFTDIELEFEEEPISYLGAVEENTDRTLLWHILSIGNLYREKGETGRRYLFLQQTALGLIETLWLPEVKMFCLSSVNTYMRYHNPSKLITLIDMAKTHLDLDIGYETTICQLLRKIKAVICTPWRPDNDIEKYRIKNEGCCMILELLLFDSLKNCYPHFFR